MKISNLVCKTCLWKPLSVMLIVKRLGRQIIKKLLQGSNPKDLNRIAKVNKGYLCLMDIEYSCF